MKESRDSVNEKRTGYCKGKKDGIVWRKEGWDNVEERSSGQPRRERRAGQPRGKGRDNEK